MPNQTASTPTAARFTGKSALISGGGTGIGAAVARRLAAEGARVAVVGRRPGPLEAVARELGPAAIAISADIARPEGAQRAVAEAVEQFGGVDVLIANAGGHYGGAVADTGDEEWRLSTQNNLDSAFFCARAALPHLIERRGSIVFLSSLAGLFSGPQAAGYVTTKHALIGLTRSVARDYGRHGVRANAVCPGWVRTPMADEEMSVLCVRHGISLEDAYRLATKDTALRRPAEPEEVASVVAFLASAEAAAMTGTMLVVDAGASCVDLPTLAFVDDRAQAASAAAPLSGSAR